MDETQTHDIREQIPLIYHRWWILIWNQLSYVYWWTWRIVNLDRKHAVTVDILLYFKHTAASPGHHHSNWQL